MENIMIANESVLNQIEKIRYWRLERKLFSYKLITLFLH